MARCGFVAVVLCGMLSLCGGLLLDDMTCSGKCGQQFDVSLPCQCNAQCQSHGNCCPDYATVCTSCSGKCGQGYHSHLPCQCNSGCSSHSNCCQDYPSVCSGRTCSHNFTDVTEALWQNDVNWFDVSMNFQHHVTSSTTSDLSPAPLFSQIDPAALSARPTFQKFLALQDNYRPDSGVVDHLTAHQNAEVDAFLESVLQTPVMNILLDYLICLNKVKNQADLRAQLKTMWFVPYTRHPGGTVDTSGFEHVMVGEYTTGAKVNGLHNWLGFYHKEQAHQINYYGYVFHKSPRLVGVNFEWNGRHKALSGFFAGTSPEFDLALFTLCALTGQGHAMLAGHSVRVRVYDVSFVSGLQIATAYPSS